jgi:hypothetical protein
MSRIYRIDGQEVIVSWISRQHPAVYTITVAGTPTAGSVEKTAGGKFHAIDARGRSLGTFLGLRAAVEQVVREEQG